MNPSFDLVVIGTGEAGSTAAARCRAAGVRVNEYLQSVSNPSVYAAGDAAHTGGLPNTPCAEYEGGLAAANLLEGNRHKTDFRASASVVYTIPPLARVGTLEDAARRVAEPCSAFKVLVEETTGRILGAHLLGPDAGELANVFVLAMRAELSAGKLKECRFAYPTQASNVQWML